MRDSLQCSGRARPGDAARSKLRRYTMVRCALKRVPLPNRFHFFDRIFDENHRVHPQRAEPYARATMSMINDMQDALFTFPTPNGGNHPLWVLGHMAYVEGELVQHMMLGQPNPVAHWKSLFGPGSQPSADPSSVSAVRGNKIDVRKLAGPNAEAARHFE